MPSVALLIGCTRCIINNPFEIFQFLLFVCKRLTFGIDLVQFLFELLISLSQFIDICLTCFTTGDNIVELCLRKAGTFQGLLQLGILLAQIGYSL